MSDLTTVGVDLAKNVIVISATDKSGRKILSRQFSFAGFGEWAANLPPCTFGMEACSCSHYWARRLSDYGHTVRLIAGEFVNPFRKSRSIKTDRNDAQAILTAVRQPDMRFVSIKSVEQQSMLVWHRMRAGFIQDQVALMNRMRGLLAEFGIWLRRSPSALRQALTQLQGDERLPTRVRPILIEAQQQLHELEQRIERCDVEVGVHAKQSEAAQRIVVLNGVGPVTASAVIATVPRATDFKNGRQMAAWIGLVPSQRSSGGQARLGSITKRGDAYLRRLLVQGACSAMLAAQRRAPESDLAFSSG
ncbi:MAG TPA: IS110 family transposase [Steroidobacteraceae bacterium]|nr:IS110 family transposase [Steroidobacteraceae bacterium]